MNILMRSAIRPNMISFYDTDRKLNLSAILGGAKRIDIVTVFDSCYSFIRRDVFVGSRSVDKSYFSKSRPVFSYAFAEERETSYKAISR